MPGLLSLRNSRTPYLAVALLVVLCAGTSSAQFPGGGRGGRGRSGGGGFRFDPAQMQQFQRMREQMQQGATPGAAATPADGQKPEDAQKPGEPKPDEGPPPVTRPMNPSQPADESELDVGPDGEGKITFSFKGQPWPAVLEWLADVSDMSLQWEEAPAGYLDLTTRGKYTVDEVRDLLNSVLLAKGFTLLRNGEVLIVANLKKLDLSLVPRVTVKELDDRGSHEPVKVFFDLDWLVAERAAEEIKPLLSTFGKVTALKSTNRLDVLDTASNLIRIRDLLEEEQSDTGQQRLVREFKLRYTRANEVLATLNTLLGLETKKSEIPLDPRQAAMQMQMQQMQQMQQQQQQQPGAPLPGRKEESVFLAVNSRENSILVNAPPDKMAVIEQAVDAIDVRQASDSSLLGGVQRMQVYRLAGISPDALVNVLNELGGLDPTSRLEVDDKKNALIAYAPLVDHVMIRALVEKLDGAARKFEVLQLRMLSAEYVAGSIITLMQGPEKPAPDQSRNRWSYYDGGSQPAPQETSTDKFWVEADVERNRLLLRANEVELAEVKALLAKLGEIPPNERNMNTMRIVPGAPGDDMQRVLDRLERLWPSVSPNPLEIDEVEAATRPRRKPAAKSSESPKSRLRKAPADDRPTEASVPRRDGGRYHFAQDRTTKDSASESDVAAAEDDATDEAETVADADKSESADDSDADDSDADSSGADDNSNEKKSPDREDEAEAPAESDSEEAPSDEPADGATEEPSAEVPYDEAAEPADGATETTDNESESGDAEGADGEMESLPEEMPPDEASEGEAIEGDSADNVEQLLPRAARAPVKISVGPQGLVISSSDTEALDRLEELLANVMPPRANHKFFSLKHTYANEVALLLKDIFKDETGKDTSKADTLSMLFNGGGSSTTPKARATLGKRKPLAFIADDVTNTILVQGADAAQLSEIEELIEFYDRQETPNSESVRRTARVGLRYAKAEETAEVIKDVFRDLLSPNDKALQNTMQQQPQRDRNQGFYSSVASFLSEDSGSENLPRFKGMLSVGVDERSNGLLVSAPQILLTQVLKMIQDLDDAARPSRPVVKVRRLSKPGHAAIIKRALAPPPSLSTPTGSSPDTLNGPGASAAPGTEFGQPSRLPRSRGR